MKRTTTLVRAALVLTGVLLLSAAASLCFAIEPERSQSLQREEREDYIYREPYYREPLVVDVWTNRGEGAVYSPGERIRVYFRASADCYVTLYNVDTEGYVHLLYPARSLEQHFIQGGITYRIPSRRDPYDLVVSGPSGIEYIEAVASVVPFNRDMPWYLDPEYSEWESEQNPWEALGDEYGDYGDDYEYYDEMGMVRGDPYLGIQRINRRMIAEDYPPSDYATAVTSFYVSERVSYPRYVCYDCHWHSPYFNPYARGCVVFDIRIDRTWVYSPRIYVPDYRPRYYYSVRATAPEVYREKRHYWSSRDGFRTLHREFAPERPVIERPERKPAPGTWQPKAGPGGEIRWEKESGPSGLKTWKSGKAPTEPPKIEQLKRKLETRGFFRPKAPEGTPEREPGPREPSMREPSPRQSSPRERSMFDQKQREQEREAPKQSVTPSRREKPGSEQSSQSARQKNAKKEEEKKVKSSSKSKEKSESKSEEEKTRNESGKKKDTSFWRR